MKAVSETLQSRPMHQVLAELVLKPTKNYDEEKVDFSTWFGMQATPDAEKEDSEEENPVETEERGELRSRSTSAWTLNIFNPPRLERTGRSKDKPRRAPANCFAARK